MTDHTHLELLTDVSDVSIIVHHLNKGQVVPLTTLVVIMVVSRGDLDGSSAKRHIHHIISNNRKLSVAEWMEAVFPNQVLLGWGGGGGGEGRAKKCTLHVYCVSAY